jgi:hypothetical protein
MNAARCTRETDTKRGNGNTRLSYTARSIQTLAFLILALALPHVGQAATFAVNATEDMEDVNLEDNLCGTAVGTCTLRTAIEQSNATPGEDVISLPAGQYILTLGQLVIEDNLTIRGEGASTITSDGTIIDGTIIDGNGKSRVLMIGLDLLVCDVINDSVLRYGAQTGRFIEAFVPSGIGGLDGPGAATIGPGGDLFVGAFLSGVHRYNSITGDFIERFTASSSGASLEPTDLGVFGGADELFVTDFLGENFLPPGSVLRFDEGTNAFVEFIPPGSGGLASPNSLASTFTENLAPNNRQALYVTSVGPDEVLRYDLKTGAFIDTFVSAGSGGLSRARGLAFGPDRNLYVASERNDRILRYDSETGAFIDTFVSAGSGGLDRPTDLTFGSDGNLYVISRSSGGPREVLRFDGESGVFIDTFIPAGQGGLGSAGCLVFESGVGRGPTVNIHRVTIQNGNSSFGGGIFVPKGSTLSLTRSIVNGNRALSFGSGIFNKGTLNVTASTITRNAGGDRGGGGIENSGGTVTLLRSTIDNNDAVGGGFTGGGGIENIGGILTITNSTISGNQLTGGVASRGGGINNALGGTTNLLNVTIANNRVAARRTARVGGGIHNGGDSTVNLTNTIIDGNRAPTGPDCSGTLIFGGFNLISNATGCDIRGTGAMVTSARLVPLADNSGPTRTHALCTALDVPDDACFGASPAIDAGDNASCPARDQRDAPRVANCDIGAFEAFSSPAP